MQNILTANKLNLISVEKFEKPFECEAKIRSSQKTQKVLVTPINDDEIKVEFENMQSSITNGQSIVLYDKDVVIGGGIIEKTGG